jgi:hypothetical protein
MTAAGGRSTFKAPTRSPLLKPPSDSSHPLDGVSFRNMEMRDGLRRDGFSIPATRSRSTRGDLEPTLIRAYMASVRTPGSGSSRADVKVPAANEALGPIRPIRMAASDRAKALPLRSCRISR